MLRNLKLSAASLWIVLSVNPAHAHHPLGGTTARTWMEGLASGLGHPVIGIDHLVFTIGLGILAACVPQGWIMAVAYLVMAAFGVSAHLSGFDVWWGEGWVALSVVAMAAALILRDKIQVPGIVALGALGGFAHGYALTESIIGAEPAPLSFYLVGLAMCQLGIAFAVYAAVQAGRNWQPRSTDRAIATVSAVMLIAGVAVPMMG